MIYLNYKGETDMKFLESLTKAKTTDLRESNGKINQTDRNALRNILIDALCQDIGAVMTSDGAVIEFEHDYWGSLCIEVTLKMKDPNFDLDTARQEYEDRLEMAEAKKLESAKRAAERAAKTNAVKSTKEKKTSK
jgi:hypothetical protein